MNTVDRDKLRVLKTGIIFRNIPEDNYQQLSSLPVQVGDLYADFQEKKLYMLGIPSGHFKAEDTSNISTLQLGSPVEDGGIFIGHELMEIAPDQTLLAFWQKWYSQEFDTICALPGMILKNRNLNETN